MRIFKIILSLIGTTAIIFLIFIIIYGFRIKHRRDNFSLVKTGQSKETVINSMGNASEIRVCNFPIYGGLNKYIGNCAEIITYHGVTESWAFAFDSNGNVVEKYYWFLDDYGKRPPDVDY